MGSQYGKVPQIRNTRWQANCQSAVRMDLKNVEGSCSLWFKFALKHFFIFENFLTNLVVKVYLLFVGTKQCIIDKLLSVCKNGAPIRKKGNVEKHVFRTKVPAMAGIVVETVGCRT